MTYTSYGFLLLCGLTLLLYYSVPHRAKTGVLLLAGICFLFFAGGVHSVFFVFLSGLISFFAAREMDRLFVSEALYSSGEADARRFFTGVEVDVKALLAGGKAKTRRRRQRNLIYAAAVCLELSVLVYFQYADFPNYTRLAWAELRGLAFSFEAAERISPVGISFYTLMQLSYLTEVWRGAYRASGSLLEYGLYTSFFPYIVQGPIERFEVFQKSLSKERSFSADAFAGGLFRLSWGLFKKLVLAERLSVLVGTVYGDVGYYGGIYLIFAAACFSLQLYTDFSGCVDMMLGVAELFGIRISENFKQPFFSRSDAEFWRRWHISLGNWFKDYLMYPLLRTKLFTKIGKWSKRVFGKQYGKRIAPALALVPVWFLLGLWHGGMWTFIIGSGLLHCFYMMTAQLTEPLTKRFYKLSGIKESNVLWRGFQMLRTFVLVSIGFVFFRSDSLTMAFDILKGMLHRGEAPAFFSAEGVLSLGVGAADLTVLLLGLLLLLAVSLRLEKTELVTAVGAQAELPSFADRMTNSYTLSCEAHRPEWQSNVGCPDGYTLSCEAHRPEGQSNMGCPDGYALKLLYACLLFLAVVVFGFYGQGYDAAAFIYSAF